jgi:hypothetical protein
MKTRRIVVIALLLMGSAYPERVTGQLPLNGLPRRNASKLADEPGTITVEGLLPSLSWSRSPKKPPSIINSDFQRPLGSMAQAPW